MTVSQALRLDRIGLNVNDLARAMAFYTGALGFIPTQASRCGPRLG